MSVDFSAIGQRMKQRRSSLGMTQDNLAELLGVSVGYISQVERGATRVNLETLSNIAMLLQCDLTQLLADVVPQRQGYLSFELQQLTGEMNETQLNLLVDIAKTLKQRL